MNLFLRFMILKKEILIDDIPIQQYSKEVLCDKNRTQFQDPFLFHGTVASNIRMYQDITDEEDETGSEFVDAHLCEQHHKDMKMKFLKGLSSRAESVN